MSKQFYFKQFNSSNQFSPIWPQGWTLLGTTTLGQSGPESDGNERVLCILKSWNIIKASQSDCLESNAGHSLWVEIVLILYRDAVGVFGSLSRLGHIRNQYLIPYNSVQNNKGKKEQK